MKAAYKPDCIIYICLSAHGRPQKFAYAVSLVDAEGHVLFAAAKFFGIGSRVEAEMLAVKLGLEQAERLKQEKVEVRLGPLCAGEYFRGLPRDERLKSMGESLLSVYEKFRLRRILQVPGEQMRETLRLATKASRGIRNLGDLQDEGRT